MKDFEDEGDRDAYGICYRDILGLEEDYSRYIDNPYFTKEKKGKRSGIDPHLKNMERILEDNKKRKRDDNTIRLCKDIALCSGCIGSGSVLISAAMEKNYSLTQKDHFPEERLKEQGGDYFLSRCLFGAGCMLFLYGSYVLTRKIIPRFFRQ